MAWAAKASIPGMVNPQVAQAVMANLAGAETVREVRAIMKVKSPNTAQRALQKAHNLGLVNFEPRTHGSLRTPAVRIVEDWGVRAGS